MAYPVITQPQVAPAFVTSISTGISTQWNSDIFDCCDDMGVCLCGTFVPCILACKVASDYGECCCLPMIGGSVLAMRTGMRERFRIP
ncbi:hypothetical protein GDO86_018076, partial [Hymenochirus boettgeri]